MPNATKTLQHVREFARRPYAWPGGYPKILIMADGATVCSECDHCGKATAPAYGEED